jgi:hypothetical protein
MVFADDLMLRNPTNTELVGLSQDHNACHHSTNDPKVQGETVVIRRSIPATSTNHFTI